MDKNNTSNMFAARLIPAAELQTFFEKFNIPLDTDSEPVTIDKKVLGEMFLEAHGKSRIFASFVMYSLLDLERNNIQTCFSSYEEVETAYASFLCGALGYVKN